MKGWIIVGCALALFITGDVVLNNGHATRAIQSGFQRVMTEILD
jgi:hypothetical protein